MRLEMELEFDKYCVIDASPTTVLPLHGQHSSKKTEKRRSNKGYFRYSNDVFSLKQEAIARSFSASCKTTRKVSIGNDQVRKRGSVYQSSNEVRLMQKIDANTQEREKIELSRNRDTPFSFDIVESLCSSDEDMRGDTRRDSVMSLRSHMNMANVKDMKILSNDGRCPVDKYSTLSYKKSLSAKLTLPHSPVCSEPDPSRATSPKTTGFDHVRWVLDPFVKSKFQNTPPISSSSEQISETLSKMKTFRKSLIREFSNTNTGLPWQSEEDPLVKDYRHQSPAHLQGLLKVAHKHGVPYFDFSVKVPEEHYIAKIWKSENSIDWIYTFHSSHDVRKSNASGKGSKESSKLSSMVGQMHVCCYFSTKPVNNGVSKDSMVSEFILYNVANSRRSVVDNTTAKVYADVAKTLKVHDENSVQVSHNADVKGRLRNSTHDDSPLLDHPLATTELLTHLQAAAIVVQVPFESKENTEFKNVQEHFDDFSSSAKVNVVIQCGVHSLPMMEESQGPSGLLERWRVGGGCDCGGWDLACPLNVLGNPTVQIRDDVRMENYQPWDLFIQGKKDNTPSLSIRKTEEEGHYTVDFHAQLSTLQAFSVSISVLHTTEPYLGFAREQRSCLLQLDDSHKTCANDAVETFIDTKKARVNKNLRKSMASFIIKPPFSPIARV